MGAKAIVWMAAVALLSGGCSVVATSADVLTTRVKDRVQEALERRRNQEWAEAAWARVAGPGGFSEDHRCGFLSGFTEQVYRGAVEPPPLPPDRYHGLRYQTPAGYRAIEEWFAGFRHGVAVAQAQGYRDYVTGPSALRAPPPAPPWPVPPPAPAPAPAEPVLPPPEPVEQTGAAGPRDVRIRVEGLGVRMEWKPPTFSW